jgi:hypothetical protein
MVMLPMALATPSLQLLLSCAAPAKPELAFEKPKHWWARVP